MLQTTESSFITEIFIPLIRTLNDILDRETKDVVARHFAASIINRDDALIRLLIIQKAEGEFSQKLFTYIINMIDNDKFMRIVSGIRDICENPPSGDESDTLDMEAVNRTYRNMLESEKGKHLKGRIDEEERIQKQKALLKAGLNSILKGETKVLKNKQVMQSLPSALINFLGKGQERTAETLIDKLRDGLYDNAPEESLQTLMMIGERLISEKHFALMKKVSNILITRLKYETSFTPIVENICRLFRDTAEILIRHRRFSECENILRTFSILNAGDIIKDDAARQLASEILEELSIDEILDPIFNEFQTNTENKRSQAMEQLVLLGPIALDRLLNILRESQSPYERSRVIRTITDMGHIAVPSLIKQVQQVWPWYYIRNLALLFGRLGDQSHVNILRPLLIHKDIRVQRETLNTLYLIGGKYREDVFMAALPAADERLKVEIIGLLGILECEEAVPLLIEILEAESTKTSEPLIEKISNALGSIGSLEAIPVLNKIVEQKAYGKKARHAAANAIAMIQWKIKKSENKDGADEDISRLENFAAAYNREHDQTVEESAVNIMLDLITKFAREKNFTQAEAFREKLIKLDPKASTEIAKAGQIIEEEKSKSVGLHNIEIWSKLFDILTAKETRALNAVLKKGIYEKDHTIYSQGERNSRLYFVNQGELVLAHEKDGKDIRIKTLKPGDIAGGDSFFSISICTTSLKTLSRADLNFLEKEMLIQLKEDYPDIEEKLRDYCQKSEDVPTLFTKKEMDRRAYIRVDITGKISVQLVDSSGNFEGKSMRGDIIDISAGGLSFLINLSEDIAKELLDRSVNIKFILPDTAGNREIDQNATVVAVRHRIGTNHSIHLKFDKILPQFPPISLVEEVNKKDKLVAHDKEKDSFLTTKIEW